ncbi:MAG: hypothetical protein KBS66_00585 [Eubacterium sp.]|nr:hypothetical protein [Candidatus Colimonas fimequi]
MAAGRIKGITIEIGGNTTKLQQSLKSVDNQLKKTQNNLRDVNKLLKFNPRNVELMRQKQSLLSNQVKETSARLKQLQEAERQMKAQGVAANSEQFQRLRREIIETESKLAYFNGQLTAFGTVGAQRVAALGNAFMATGAKITAVGRTLTSTISLWGATAVFGGKKLIEMSEAQTQAENKLIEIYRARMGVGKEAAKSTMEVASAIQKQGVIGDEVTLSGAQMLATYAKYPATVNALLPAMDNLLVQQKGLNATQEDAANTAKLFGKVLTGNTGALSKAGITFDEAQQQVLKYGTEEEKAAVLAEVITENVGEMNKAFAETDAGKIQQAKNNLGDLGETIGATILPAFADLAKSFSDRVLPSIQKFADFMKAHPMIAKMAMNTAVLAAAVGPLALVIGKVVTGVGAIMTWAPKVMSFVTPQIAIIAGLAAALVAVWKNSENLRTAVYAAGAQIKLAFGYLLDTAKPQLQQLSTTVLPVIKSALAGIGNVLARLVPIIASVITKTIVGAAQTIARIQAILGAVKSVGSKIVSSITSPFTTAYNKIKSIVNNIKSLFSNLKISIPKGIKLPHFKLTGSFSLVKGTVPKLSVDWYKTAMQSGAILKGATVFGQQGGKLLGGGEVGNEIVVGQNSFLTMLNHAVSSAVMRATDQMASAMVTAMQISSSGQTAGGQMVIENYLYPSGPKMTEIIVNTYDTGKRYLG